MNLINSFLNSSFINGVRTTLQYARPADIIDIIVVAFVLYEAILLIRNTRAAQLVKGIGVIAAVYFTSEWLELIMVKYILLNAIQVGIIAVIVLFQPEFRRALEQVGRSKISQIVKISDVQLEFETIERNCREIADAVYELAKKKIGALIVIERETKLDDIINTGIATDSTISRELLSNIFIVNTPLHDGAVVVRNFRITAAACFLPLTQNTYLSSELGARHRAALGMSENSDAIVIISSEETGKVSIALDGELSRGFTADSLFTALFEMLKPAEKRKKRKN